MKKRTTNINESARSVLGITRDEYALCQYFHYRAGDPRGKKDGWCSDPKDEVAEFIGITRPGLYKMIARLAEQRLLETDPKTGFVRVTGKWIDTESECKQSLHGGVNKVYTERKQSLHSDVNKVYTHNKVEKDIELEERERRESAPAHAPENETLKAEKKEGGQVAPPAAAPPPAPKSDTALTYDQYPNPKDSLELKEALRNYFIANPREWQDGVLEQGKAAKWPPEKIQDCITLFCAHQEAEGNLRRTYGQYKGMLVKWFFGQQRFDSAGNSTQDTNRSQQLAFK